MPESVFSIPLVAPRIDSALLLTRAPESRRNRSPKFALFTALFSRLATRPLTLLIRSSSVQKSAPDSRLLVACASYGRVLCIGAEAAGGRLECAFSHQLCFARVLRHFVRRLFRFTVVPLRRQSLRFWRDGQQRETATALVAGLVSFARSRFTATQ